MNSGKIKYNHWILKFLPKKFHAITLFGNIYTRTLSIKILLHEEKHVHQQEKYGISFYFIYLKDFFKNLIKYKNFMKAYHAIPFEVEAREHAEHAMEDMWSNLLGEII